MELSDAAAAFDAYLGVRARLPAATFPAATRHGSSLAEIAAPFDLVLLDAYGVLNVGERAIPGAAETIASLRRAGKRLMVVSNSAGYPKALMMDRFARMGFDFSPDEVTTSREAMIRHVLRQPTRHWGIMLNRAHGLDELAMVDITYLEDDHAAYDAVEGFLLIGADGWTDARQALLLRALREHPRPVVVGNPDIVAPREDGLSREPGHFAHRLADDTGVSPVFIGKPFSEIFNLALARQSPRPDPERVLMVGDTLHTDILGGRHMGFATVLVTEFGSLSGANPAAAIKRSAIVPDFMVTRI